MVPLFLFGSINGNALNYSGDYRGTVTYGGANYSTRIVLEEKYDDPEANIAEMQLFDEKENILVDCSGPNGGTFTKKAGGEIKITGTCIDVKLSDNSVYMASTKVSDDGGSIHVVFNAVGWHIFVMDGDLYKEGFAAGSAAPAWDFGELWNEALTRKIKMKDINFDPEVFKIFKLGYVKKTWVEFCNETKDGSHGPIEECTPKENPDSGDRYHVLKKMLADNEGEILFPGYNAEWYQICSCAKWEEPMALSLTPEEARKKSLTQEEARKKFAAAFAAKLEAAKLAGKLKAASPKSTRI